MPVRLVLSQSLFAGSVFIQQILIESCRCCSHVGREQQETNSKSEQTEETPSDKTQDKEEEFHFVSLHEAHTFVDGLVTVHLGMVFENERHHAV